MGDLAPKKQSSKGVTLGVAGAAGKLWKGASTRATRTGAFKAN